MMVAAAASDGMRSPFRNRSPAFVNRMFTVDGTVLPPLAALGSSTFRLAFTIAADVSMKMTSNTSTMSTNGMMLIDASRPSSSPASSFSLAMIALALGRRGAGIAGLQARQQDAPQRLAVGD